MSQPRTRLGFVLAGVLIITTLVSLPLGRLFVARAAEAPPKAYRLEPSQCDGWPDSGRAKKIDLSPNAALPEFSVKNSSSFYNRPAAETDAEAVSTSDTTPTVTTLDCSKFMVPKGLPGEAKITNARVLFSLGADSYQGNEDVLTLAYSLDGAEWTTLDSFALLEDMSNQAHGGYWNFPVDELSSQEEIEKLQVRVEYHALPAAEAVGVLVDGLALDIETAEESPEPELPSGLLALNKKTFRPSEQPVISVAVAEPTPLALLGAPPKTRAVKAVRITSPAGVTADLDYDLKEKQKGQAKRHEYTVKTSNFSKPGRYTLAFEIEQDGQTQEVESEFWWGVLVLNTMKSVYRPGEKVHFGMGVLDSGGRTICDAKLELKISDPEGQPTTLTTENGTISRSETCGPQTVTNLPDYAADFTAGKTGEYPLELKATTAAGEYTITDTLYVEETVPFDITRLGPTRIYPLADYEMFLEVVPAQDYTGPVEEFVPDTFVISDINEGGLAAGLDAEGRQIIRWDVNWQAGQAYTLSYTFDPPNVSPELYLLGPAKVGEFTERRQWLIAADADITIVTTDAVGATENSHAMHNTVFTSALVGYFFYVAADDDFGVTKTTDGGQTWNVLDADVDDDTTVTTIAFDVWYDQWTPGRSGTLIYIWWYEDSDDTVVFRTLNTSNDSWGTQYTVWDFASAVTGRGTFISGAIARGNNLLVAFDIDNGTEMGTYRSTDGGATWGVRTNMVEAAGDELMMFPGNEADNQDMWALYQDADADALTLKVHDDSANTNSESSTIVSLIEQTTDGQGQRGFSGTMRSSDGHLLAVTESEYDTGTADMQTWDINGTGSITQKTAIATDKDDMYYPSVFIDATDNIYVVYIGKRDGSETLGTTAGVYYTKSTDGGANWTAGDTAYSATASDWRQTWAPLSGPRFLGVWRDISSFALMTNYDNSVTFEPRFTQNYYRFYVDNDANLPTDPWPVGGTDLAQNAPITTSDSPPDDDGLVRIRMSVQVGNAALTASSQAFQLEYAERSDGVCSSVSSWTAVDAASGSGIWRGESDSTPADGATLSSTVLDPSDRVESYEEQNDSVSNPTAIAVGEDGEWDWLIQNNGARHDTTYCFRMAKGDGTGFTTYTNYPKISTEATTFSSSFESGNGATFTKPYASDSGQVSYNSELDGGTSDPECTAYQKQNWFYFSMNNALNQSIQFTMIGANNGTDNQWTTWTNTKPVYSYDQVTWCRAGSAGTLSGNDFVYTLPGTGSGCDGETEFSQDTVYIAYNIPYTYTNLQSDLATWDVPAYVTVTDIGDSIQLREMDLITVDDDTYYDVDASKKVYWILGRQHPAEVIGSYDVKGLMDFLTGSSDEAKIMRRASIFKIIPMMNPDGVYQGWTRSNAHLCDLNREWEDTGANPSGETDEVYNAHYRIDDWMTNGTPADAETFTDYHGQTSASAEGEVYGGNAAMDGGVETPYEELFDALDSNTHTKEFGASSTVGLFNVEIYDQYNASKGSLSFTVEGPNVMFSATEYPTKQNMQAYGLAFAKSVFAKHEAYNKVFALQTTDAGSPADPDYLVVGSPGQYLLFYSEDWGGGGTRWFDLENDPNCTIQMVDNSRALDEVAWVDGGAATWNIFQTSNAALTVLANSGAVVRFKYVAEWENVSGMDYELQRTIWGDGRTWQRWSFTNNTGAEINWGTMNHQVSVNYDYTARFAFAYDNNVTTPIPGTDNWWGVLGTGAGKSSAIALYIAQTGGWEYQSYTSTDDASGKRAMYRDTDGPVQANGTNITTWLEYQYRPDTDDMPNEAAVDYYRNDIANPDTPTMTTGTFTEFDKQEGGLEFAASSNNVKFTYTNATTYTKKKPVYLFTNYTASTAPVLKVNDAYLDSETGIAHTADTYIGTQYTSWVDDANNTAYVQYLADISTNINVEIKDYFVAAGITIDGKAYSDDTELSALNGVSVCVAVDNVSDNDCDTTNASGEFTITGVDATAGGEQLTFFIDGGTTFGNTVTTGDGSDIVTGDTLRVYQNHVVTRYETGTSLAITGMDAYDNDQNATDILFDADAGSPNTLSVESTNELFVQSGYTFAPGGNVTSSHDIEIDGTWTAATSETVALSGTYKLDTGGTLNPSTSTITFNATSGTEDLITTGTGSLYGLTLDDSAGSLVVEVEDPLDINGTLTITGGTLDVVNGESNQINIAGNWANSDIFEAQGGTVVADGPTQQTFSGNLTGASAFNNLTITNYSGSDPDTSPSVIFSASASTDATFTATTASTKLRFLASGTYTFQNIALNGQATGTRVALRSSSGGTDWNLNVAGTRSVTNTDAKDSDACGQSPDIDATSITNLDSTGNFCWDFAALQFSISDITIGFGDLTTINARFATGTTGSDAKVAAHTLSARTSASGGYAITYYGATLTKGGDAINAATIVNDPEDDGTPGTEQFAIGASTNGNATIASGYDVATPADYKFVENTTSTIVSEAGPTAVEIISLYYLANIAYDTPLGAYETNVTFIMTGTF